MKFLIQRLFEWRANNWKLNISTSKAVADMKDNPFFEGSEFLLPISKEFNVSLDQINFFATHMATLVVGSLFRIVLNTRWCSAALRHFVELLLGIYVIYFCYGRQILHILIPSIVSYMFMMLLPFGVMEKVVLLFNIAYLGYCHATRMIYDYGGYTLDVTGPLMIVTQKITSLAYNVYDGNVTNPKITENMQRVSLKDVPRMHEYLSYVFCFHSIMCGPFCFFKEYSDFIDGSQFHNTPYPDRRPSPVPAVFRKLMVACFFGSVTVFVMPYFPCTILISKEFAEQSFVYKNFLVVFISCVHRYKYYFAWSLGEASNLSAGLGFNGYDKEGDPKWDLVENATISKTELATGIKQFIDNWNKTTNYWLRHVVYERTRSVFAVFIFSAFWHGFYPGYFITFVSTGLFLIVSKKIRKIVRPYFQISGLLSVMYDVLTFFMTSIAMCYVGFPFMVLLLQPTLFIYWNLYFYLHVASLIMLISLSIYDKKFKSHQD